MRFIKVVKLRGGLQWLKDKQVYRSRRVLIGDEIALMGKKALTKEHRAPTITTWWLCQATRYLRRARCKSSSG